MNEQYATYEYEPLTDDEYIRMRKTDAVEFVKVMYGGDDRFAAGISHDGYATQESAVADLCKERPSWFVAWADVQQLRYNQKAKADSKRFQADPEKFAAERPA